MSIMQLRLTRLATVALTVAILAAPATAATWHLSANVASLSPDGDAWEAVYDEQPTLFGLGLEVRPAEAFSLGLSVQSGSADGRLIAVLPSGEIVHTGGTAEIDLLPVHLTAAWIGFADRPWQLTLGGGLSYLDWSESTELGEVGDGAFGFHAVAGVRRVFDRFGIGLEGRWSDYSDAFPDAGAAEALDDHAFGGLELGLTLSYRLGR